MGHTEYTTRKFWCTRQRDTRKTVWDYTVCQGHSTELEHEMSFSSSLLRNKPEAAEYIAEALALLRESRAKCRWEDLPEQLCLEALLEGHSPTGACTSSSCGEAQGSARCRVSHSTPEPDSSAANLGQNQKCDNIFEIDGYVCALATRIRCFLKGV